LEAPPKSNPISFWDKKTETCYFKHRFNYCYPNWNKLSDWFKIYTNDGIYQDEYGIFVWVNGQGGCAALTDPENYGFRTPAIVRVSANHDGTAEIRTGEFNYDYATCQGKCRISTTKLTHTAMRSLYLLPYKIYKKAWVTILNQKGELAKGNFRLCYNLHYTERKNPAYFRFNGDDWVYYGGFWNADFSKFCMYSEISGNYVLAELGQ
jgi:hypothetical protein